MKTKTTQYSKIQKPSLHKCKLLLMCKTEASTALNIPVEVFWVMTPCSVPVGYQRFGGPCCLPLQGEVN